MQRPLTEFNFSSPSVKAERTLTELNLSTSSTPNSRKRPSSSKKRSSNAHLKQTIIDAGQKNIGLQHCAKCEMVYNIDDKDDVAQHAAFHNRCKEIKYFRVTVSQLDSWKSGVYTEVVEKPVNGILFKFNKSSTVTLKRKLENIIDKFVNFEIGYAPDLPIWNDKDEPRDAFVFIAHLSERSSPFIAGVTLIDQVNSAVLLPQGKKYVGEFFCVNRIWVHSVLRRKGLASFMLNAVLRLMIPNRLLPRTRIAFSEPTQDGVRLAAAFVGNGRRGASCYIAHFDENPSLSKHRRAYASFKNLKGFSSPEDGKKLTAHNNACGSDGISGSSSVTPSSKRKCLIGFEEEDEEDGDDDKDGANTTTTISAPSSSQVNNSNRYNYSGLEISDEEVEEDKENM